MCSITTSLFEVKLSGLQSKKPVLRMSDKNNIRSASGFGLYLLLLDPAKAKSISLR